MRAWERRYQQEAVSREEELFPGLAREERGHGEQPTPDDEEATDVGAPIDDPADLEVRGGASGTRVLRRNEEEQLEDDEEQQAVMAAEWVEQEEE